MRSHAANCANPCGRERPSLMGEIGTLRTRFSRLAKPHTLSTGKLQIHNTFHSVSSFLNMLLFIR